MKDRPLEILASRFEITEIKAIESEEENKGIFKGYASVFNNRDEVGDVVIPGAFKRTIDHHKGKFPVVKMHNKGEIVGGAIVEEDLKGLKVDGFIDLNINYAKDTYNLMKSGVIDGMSFAYFTIKSKIDNFKGLQSRLLQELALKEITVVPSAWSINPKAKITDVKSLDMEVILYEDIIDDWESKPGFEETENEIRYRVKSPGQFQENSFRRITIKSSSPRIFAIIGRLTGETTTTVQSLRFPKDDGWTIGSARSWVNEHPEAAKSLQDWPELEKEMLHGINDADLLPLIISLQQNLNSLKF